MSNMYATYGPMPGMGPRINGSLDRRALAAMQPGRASTLGRTPIRYPIHTHTLGCSYQDLRRSREFLDLKHGPMEPLQPLDTLSLADFMHGSLENFPVFPSGTIERRRNGHLRDGTCSVHGGTLSRPGSRRGSQYTLAEEEEEEEEEDEEEEEEERSYCWRWCLSLTFTLLVFLLILAGVVVALYFFFTNIPYESQPRVQEEPCENTPCSWGGECIRDPTGHWVCVCANLCPPPSSTASPICATDGITYGTMCELRRHACETGLDIRIKHSGKCDAANPCRGHKCHYGSVCVPGEDGDALCSCPDECRVYGGGMGSNAVCGSDGQNYANECELRRHACRTQKHLEIRYIGKCDPCEDIDCPERQICLLNSNREPMCRCNDVCDRQFIPVCASDGKTYTNECVMKVEACRARKTLSIIFHGTCTEGLNPCAPMTCLPGQECNVDLYGQARCQCPHPCQPVMRPVCGTDGSTYDNLCELHRTVCMRQAEIFVEYVGVCGEEGPCAGRRCSHGGICIERQGVGVCECPQCPANLDPVCGTDGISYGNECLLRAEACRIRRPIPVRYRGMCSGCEDKVCDFYGVCEANDGGEGKCVCPQGCDEVESKVCGTDGVTYINECLLKVASCNQQQLILVTSKGHCDLCQHVNCKLGARCEAGRCVCPTQCPDTWKPICATDGKTYANECEMEKTGCGVAGGLSVAFVGECSEMQSSPDFEISPCNGEAALVNLNTGQDYYCGKGADSQVCPLNSYCHWTPSFAKCCPLRQGNITSDGPRCEDSAYGCCPDRRHPALAPNYAGCPSICQCHKLGADDPVCDPITSQCVCKRGVGGSKCDRCEPGYWGLPRIQFGSNGCLPCGCSLFGSVRDDCEQMTGQCVCKPGISGQKCNSCPDGLVLRPTGCVPESESVIVANNCAELQCYFGARCVEFNGQAKCKCEAECPADSRSTPRVCGSDGNTYINECDLRLYTCIHQKDIVIDSLGPCTVYGNQSDGSTESPLRRSTAPLSTEPHRSHTQKSTRHLHHQYIVGGGAEGSSEGRDTTRGHHHNFNSIFSGSTNTAEGVTIVALGLLGSICYEDKDCSVAYSMCKTSVCICRSGYTQSTDRLTCIVNTPGREEAKGVCSREPCQGGGTCHSLPDGSYRCECPPRITGIHCDEELAPPYEIPSFSGSSYMELNKIKAYNKVQVEMEFRTFTDSGILLYSQQQVDGMGDFLSLAIVDGFVEFRYNLGSGPAVIRSHQRVQMKRFHRVVAKRYQRDGILQLDDFEDASGRAPGNLKSLDLRGSTYIGYVPTSQRRVWENAGTSEGLVGCIREVRLNGRPVDLIWPGSIHVTHAEDIGDCSMSPCISLPCINGGSCRPTHHNQFKCLCPPPYTGTQCEVRLDACHNDPCQSGATCVSLPNHGFKCNCTPGRTGTLCDQMDRTLREIVIPDFDGDAYLELPTLENVGRSVILELWFLTRSPDGVLLYNGQIGGGGDFIALNLRNGRVEFSYNLGSGVASLVSPTRVPMNKWHVVRVRRKKRRGVLRVNRGRRVMGKSGPRLRELNLNQPLFLGGLKNYSLAHPDSGVRMGLNGAIQRLLVNSEVFDNIEERATAGRGVRRYRGAPCGDNNPCNNGGVCQPFRNRFLCKCLPPYTGKYCEKRVDEEQMMKPVKFTGRTFMKFPNMVYRIRRGQTTNHFEMRFRATSSNGVLIWLNKGSSITQDYLSLTLNEGFVQLSFNLGTQREILFITSKVRVDDGQWHTLVMHRRKRLGVLRVDSERPVKGVAERGSTTLNTNGKLWIGGCPKIPYGFPAAYYEGFNGCIDSIQIENRDLNLMSQNRKNNIQFCDEMR